MVNLPISIENYLQEAGFTPTEMLILKRLLEGQAVTLRELAAKTGKSTGVLDQATKKLIDRKIVTKENINDSSKYAISSLEAINKWMKDDMEHRHAVLDRKKQDFEAFISTVKHESSRPDMEYFEGLSGIEQAFSKLLTMGKKEWLHFIPATMREEDDPLVEFKVKLFRERRNQKTFMRVISSDVPLGRRYQNRDMFEYRDTRLVKPDDFPVSFEQFIVGDTVACIDVQGQKASFIRYPELAESQSKIFEMLWCKAGDECNSDEECALKAGQSGSKKPDLETKVFSGLREFFMSRKSIATFGLLGIVAALMTWGMYANNAKLNTERIREQIIAVVSTAVTEFDSADIHELRTEKDINKPEWEKVVLHLQDIRVRNPDLKYVYILRPTGMTNMFEFVADADSLDPYAKIDLNNDGVIDDADALSPPGDPYDASDNPGMTQGLKGPYADAEPYTDQWGTFISSFAPIVDENGIAVAVFGVDRIADDIQRLTLNTFSPTLYFLGFFLLFVVVRLAAFHRSLCQELIRLTKTRHIIVSCGLCAVAAAVVTLWMYNNVSSLNTERVRDQVKAIAATAAQEFAVSDLHEIQIEEDIQKPEWEKVVLQLRSVRDRNPDIRYVYILRPTKDPDIFEFVSDADSLDPYAKIDLNSDGVIDDADALSPPGDPYDVSEIPGVTLGMQEPSADEEPFTDQWGTFISGFAPIKDKEGNTVAVLGVDRIADDVQELTFGTFKPIRYFLGVFLLLAVVRLVVFHQSLFQQLIKLSRKRRVLMPLAVCAFIAFGITASMQWYTLKLLKGEIGEKLMSICATAAPDIDVKDLEPLRFGRDMRRPEYQRVYNKLNEIRDSNKDIWYVYIMRPDEIYKDMYVFVADADSNYFLPEDPNDPDAIEVVPPGTFYDSYFFGEEYAGDALVKAVAEKEFITDKWGTYLSGAAPIFDENGVAVAFIGVDMDVSDIYAMLNTKFRAYIWFIGIFIAVLLARLYFVWNYNPKSRY